MGGLLRILSCLLLFGLGAEGLTPVIGNTAAVIASAVIALAVNRLWRQQQRAERAAQHREDRAGKAGSHEPAGTTPQRPRKKRV